MDSNTKPQNPKPDTNQSNTSKFHKQFLYKALIVTLILLIIPLYPSQAPEFINQTVSTRSWELLHLLFVGIAVSYGLFSTRSDETGEKGNGTSRFDNAQSYVTKLLQVSSVFDDDCETSLVGSDVGKVQMWGNRYSRGEPVVVVANENSVVDEHRGVNISSRIGEKPLFLPVRSLKCVELGGEDGGDVYRSVSRSNSSLGSKRGLRIGGNNNSSWYVDSRDSDGMVEGNGVLPSPIPWRSRSGRMEFKEEVNDNNDMYSMPPPSMNESEFNRVEPRFTKPQSIKTTKPNSMSFSQISELQAKNVEDIARKNNIHKPSTPPVPPPPPPPPMMSRKPPLGKSYSSSSKDNNVISPEREFRGRSTSEAIDHMRVNGGEDMLRRVNSSGTTEAKSRAHIDTTMMGKSVRTTRSNDSFGVTKKPRESVEAVNEVEASKFENTGKRAVRPDQTALVTPKKEDYMDEVLVETEDEWESESESEREDENLENGGGEHKAAGDGPGPDVDKKADEFIAKFREQIRLQRINSIKRSSGQINRNPPR